MRARWLLVIALASLAPGCGDDAGADRPACSADESRCGGATGCYALCLCRGGGEAACESQCDVAADGPETRDVSVWPESSEEDDLLALINARRAQGGCCGGGACFAPASAVAPDPSLTTAARRHAADMAARGYFAHDTPEGVSFEDRIRGAGFVGCVIGENLAAGYPTAEEVVSAWMNSREHCENLLWPAFSSIGVARALDSSADGVALWVADFGG